MSTDFGQLNWEKKLFICWETARSSHVEDLLLALCTEN